MRHKKSIKKLNRTTPHRLSMLNNMAASLILHEQIKTTLPKAKALRPYVEKLVTLAKKKNLSSIRTIVSKIKPKETANKLINVLSVRYGQRPGGYTRIVKAGFRFGDSAPVAYISFIDV